MRRVLFILLIGLLGGMAGCERPHRDEPEVKEVTGSFLAAYNLNGQQIWELNLGEADYRKVQVAPWGEVVLTGYLVGEPAGQGVVAVVDPLGDISWVFKPDDWTSVINYSVSSWQGKGRIEQTFLDETRHVTCVVYPETGQPDCRVGHLYSLDQNGDVYDQLQLEGFSPYTPYSTKVDLQFSPTGDVYYLHEHDMFDLDLVVGFNRAGENICLYQHADLREWLIGGDSLYVCTADGYLRRLDLAGTQLWQQRIEVVVGYPELSWSPAGYLVVQNQEQQLLAQDADGRELWRFAPPDLRVSAPISYTADNGMFLSGWEDSEDSTASYRLYLDADGNEIWRYRLPENLENCWQMPGAGSTAVLLITTNRGHDKCISYLDAVGNEQWKYEAKGLRQVIRAPTGHICYVQGGTIGLLGSTGDVLWEHEVIDIETYFQGRPLITAGLDGTVYVYYNTAVEDTKP